MFAYGTADVRGVAVRSFYQAWYQRATPLERGEGALTRSINVPLLWSGRSLANHVLSRNFFKASQRAEDECYLMEELFR